MRLLIVDDEPLARANLALLCELKDGVAVVGEADSGRAAITAAEQLHPDVILLDTQLPDMTGLEVLRAARRTAAPLGIMVTTYPEQAAPPLETGVIDCLVKPIHIARFTESLERARRCYRSNGAPAEQTHRPPDQGRKLPEAAEPAAATGAEPMQRELFARAVREKMPVERASVTHKFSVGGHEGYITVGMYTDGRPGEIFIKMSKEGSTLSGVMDGLALTISLGLQYGVPMKVYVDKLVNTRFEPSGITANPNIRFVSSVLDYIARWLGGRFISPDYLKLHNGEHAAPVAPVQPLPTMADAMMTSMQAGIASSKPRDAHEGAPTCSECGMLMVPNGACYKCEDCGSTSGCS